MKLILKSYEIDLINYCLRIVINRYKQPFDLNYKRPFFDRYSQISIEKLITSRTTDELVENLRSTEYYAPLKRLKDAQDVTLYDYNLTLDLYYFTSTWKEQKKVLKKADLELFMRTADQDRPSEPAVDLPGEEILQYEARRHLSAAHPDPLQTVHRPGQGNGGRAGSGRI